MNENWKYVHLTGHIIAVVVRGVFNLFSSGRTVREKWYLLTELIIYLNMKQF